MTGFSTPAILLRQISHGDFDLILTFLSLNQGKITVIAKYAKKSVKRFSGVLELFQVVDIVCTRGRGKLPILKEASIVQPFIKIRGNIQKTAYASYWAQLIHQWMEEGRQEDRMYQLFYHVLDAMDAERLTDDASSILFQIKFLALSGFYPNFEQCCRCSCPLARMKQTRVLFDLGRGGLLCHKCRPENSRHLTLSTGTIKQLHWLGTMPLEKAGRIKFSSLVQTESLNLLETFLPYHLGFRPRSLAFIRGLRDEARQEMHWAPPLKKCANGG